MSRMSSMLAAGIAMMGLAPLPALAKDPPIADYRPLEEKNVLSGKAKIAPDKGYIFLRAPSRTMASFVREPDAQDRADYDFLQDKEFQRQVKSYPRKLAAWQAEIEAGKKQSRRYVGPPKPEEPTRASASIGDIEKRTILPVGPMFMYSKAQSGDEYRYLQEVKPGTYIYYGPVLLQPGGVGMGTCFCMGSVKFEVKAGEITDLGNFLTFVIQDMNLDIASDPAIGEKQITQASFGLPPSLAGHRSVKARFRASGKRNNFLGITVSRLPAIPGITAYRRDTVIDLTSDAATSTDTAATQSGQL